MRRWPALAAALTLGLGLTLGGCTSESSPEPAAAVPPDVAVLIHSGDALATTPYHAVYLNSDFRTTFDTDPVRQLSRQGASLPGSTAVTTESRQIGHDIWSMLQRDTWIHVDLTRVRPESLAAYGLHLIIVEAILPGVTTATPTGTGSFEGTINLDRAMAATADPALKLAQQSMLQASGSPVLSYEATVDGQGRLTSITCRSGVGDASVPTTDAITITYGAPEVTVEPPPADLVVEATDQMYATY
jgi:hypothetical protein